MKRLFKTVLVVFLSVVVVSVASFFYMNRTPPQLKEPNYFNYYKNQDLVVEGKVGIFISHLIMPEDMAAVDFHNLAMKTKQYIPWPPKLLFDKDDGVVLMDEDRFYEFEEFIPTKLIDADGKDKDIDGTPYIVKYHEGLIEWVPPRRSLHLSPGNFLMTARKVGLPTVSSKLINKANLY